MTVDMSTFGDMLLSRPSGREAFMGALAYVFPDFPKKEKIILDFAKVKVLTPSWIDEFIIGIKKNLTQNIQFINIDNPSVSASLQTVVNPIDVTTLKKK